MGTTSRPYESGSAEADYHEATTGETAESMGVSTVVPVIVTDPVKVETREARYLTTDQIAVSAVPLRLASTHRTRSRLRITARGGAVTIGGSQVTPGTGYLLPADESVELTSNGEVYAIGEAGAVAHLLAEHRDA